MIKFRWKTQFKETPIGKIPKDWGIKTIGEIAKIKGGKRLPKGGYLSEIPNDHPYIRVVDIVDGKINLQYPVICSR